MKEVTQELEVQKSKRTQEINENQEIRAKISQAINDYKKKEEGYRSKMESHGKII
jgi:chromosome segregation ATPase